MIVSTSLSERRSVLGRMILDLTNRRGPLNESERTRLSTYTSELEHIEKSFMNSAEERYSAAFSDWLRHGSGGISQRSQQAIAEVRSTLGFEGLQPGAYPLSSGGQFAPVSFLERVVASAKLAGPWFDPGFASIDDTPTGASKGYPTDNDTAVSGTLVVEGGQQTQQDVTVGLQSLSSYKFSSQMVLASVESFQDTGVDGGLEGYLSKKFGIRIMRGANPYLTTGTGSGQPTGCLHGITAALTATGSADTDGIGGSNTIGHSDVCALEQALDPMYRVNAHFMMHPSTLNWLRNVKDKNLRPVFSTLNGPTPYLLNYPIKLNVGMDVLQTEVSSPAVTRVPLAFGDFSYFKVRRSWPIVQRKAEQWAIYGQIGFSLLWRIDSRLIDGGGQAVQTLQTVF